MTTDHTEHDSAEVIDFVAILKGGGVEPKMVVKRARNTCISCSFVFDEKERTIECPKCGRQWEAFEALVRLARDWQNFALNRTALRSEVKRLNEDRERLRKDVANLKAAKRRADDVVTALLAGLKRRRKLTATATRSRDFIAGVEAALYQVEEFIKSDVWRPNPNPPRGDT